MKRAYPFLLTDERPFIPGQAKAIVCAAGATAARMAVDPLIDSGLYFTFIFPAIFIAGIWGGNRSAVATAILGGAVAAYIWIPTRYSFDIQRVGALQLVVFALSSALQVAVVATVNGLLIALERSEQKSLMLADEMRHRLANVLALVQSVARQTFTENASSEKREIFGARLAALAKAQNLLRAGSSDAIELTAFVTDILAPFDLTKFEMTGPRCFLSSETGTNLALVLHELATNAVKYGALSADGGQIQVAWMLNNDKAQLIWRESGGPFVAPPQRTGFGSRLLKSVFSDGHKIEFAHSGLHAEMRVPIQPS